MPVYHVLRVSAVSTQDGDSFNERISAAESDEIRYRDSLSE